MSATDSDNSIDWLASDYEDNESEQEFDSSRKHSQTEAPPSPRAPPPHLGPSDDSCRVKDCEDWGEVREASGRRSPPGRTETWVSSIGHYKRQQGDKTHPQQALKRPRSSAEEERKERQLLSDTSEKGRVFYRKVRTRSTYVCFSWGGGGWFTAEVERGLSPTSTGARWFYRMPHA